MALISLIATTYADLEIAQTQAKHLVKSGYVACASAASGLVSSYIWQGKLTSESEVCLICKTAVDGTERAMTAIEQSHPYDFPEIITWQVQTTEAYGVWVEQNTTKSEAK